jgi:hypothetical protein
MKTFLSLIFLFSFDTYGAIILTPVDYGTYVKTSVYGTSMPGEPSSNSGFHDPNSQTLYAGFVSLYSGHITYEYLNFYIFDLTEISFDISAATLSLPGAVASGLSTGSYRIWNTSNSVGDLIAGGSNQAEIFSNLSGIPLFGEQSATSSTFDYSIAGNEAFVHFLNANKGKVVAFAGDAYYAGHSPLSIQGTPTLILSIPEPSTPALLLSLGVTLAIIRKFSCRTRRCS